MFTVLADDNPTWQGWWRLRRKYIRTPDDGLNSATQKKGIEQMGRHNQSNIKARILDLALDTSIDRARNKVGRWNVPPKPPYGDGESPRTLGGASGDGGAQAVGRGAQRNLEP